MKLDCFIANYHNKIKINITGLDNFFLDKLPKKYHSPTLARVKEIGAEINYLKRILLPNIQGGQTYLYYDYDEFRVVELRLGNEDEFDFARTAYKVIEGQAKIEERPVPVVLTIKTII